MGASWHDDITRALRTHVYAFGLLDTCSVERICGSLRALQHGCIAPHRFHDILEWPVVRFYLDSACVYFFGCSSLYVFHPSSSCFFRGCRTSYANYSTPCLEMHFAVHSEGKNGNTLSRGMRALLHACPCVVLSIYVVVVRCLVIHLPIFIFSGPLCCYGWYNCHSWCHLGWCYVGPMMSISQMQESCLTYEYVVSRKLMRCHVLHWNESCCTHK